ncbi:MAG: hypothetical protein QOH55_1854, partial [Microbacteriaceae bacterium]|nr:hypothetical protein [Microbacteriaceae bacterium]
MEHLKYGQLDVSIAESATALGVAAAEDFAKTVRAA